MKLLLSVVVPVYNRPDETRELLESLALQTDQDFEVVIIEDGSSLSSRDVCEDFSNRLNIAYYYKSNSGPGDSRNYGMSHATGNYFLIFDSDCLIPPHYMATVKEELDKDFVHCFGGPDAAHDSFSDVQKAINYAMTSFWTTGGIRGKSEQLAKFQPRSFNMGISKEVFERTNGFSDIHPGEDPDLSLRIKKLGYASKLIPEAFVFHKRRISFEKFKQQVRKFGLVRPILNKWHPGSSSIVYWFPTVFIVFVILSILLTIAVSVLFIIPLSAYLSLLFLDALLKTKSLKIAAMAAWSAMLQLFNYGWGFLLSFLQISVLGKEERTAFPRLFFK